MNFIGQNLRMPVAFQLLSAASLICLIVLFFSYFIDKPKYQKQFFEFHASRSEHVFQMLHEDLLNEIQASPENISNSTFNQQTTKAGLSEALLVDCSANIYASTNPRLTGQNIFSPEISNLSSGLALLDMTLLPQVTNSGSPIARDFSQTSRYYISELPCISQQNSELSRSALIVFFDWSEIIQANLKVVDGVAWRERLQWIALSLLMVGLIGISLVPRFLRLAQLMKEATERPNASRYESNAFDEFDLVGQRYNELIDSFEKRLSEMTLKSNALTLGYAAFEHSNQAVCILSAEHRIVDINTAYLALTGYCRDEMIGRALESILPDELAPQDGNDKLHQHFFDGKEQEAWGFRKDGARYRKALRLVALYDPEGAVTNFFYIERNITREYEQRKELELLAKTDPLTGIYNRRRFESDLRVLQTRSDLNLAIGIINLDSMRGINSEYGKRVGDAVMVEACRRLMIAVSGTRSNVYRFEGDEFYIVFEDTESEQELERHARAILISLVGDFTTEDARIEINAGMGIAKFDEASEDLNLTLNHAYLALRHAKNSGRSKVVHAHDYVLSAERRKLGISLALKSSKLTEKLRLSYQPKINIQHSVLVGAEALLSWDFPQLGYISKDELFSVAAETGDLFRIEEWAIGEAISNTEKFSNHIDGFQTSIKVSTQLLSKKSFVPELVQRVKSMGVSTESFVLELSQEELAKDQDNALEKIKELRQAGIGIHLRDFSLGPSSNMSLTDIPIDAIKFSKTYLEKQPNQDVLKMILSIAKVRNIPVIAEGVESTYHLALLKQIGCELCQGYLYSEPTAMNSETDIESVLSYWQKSVAAVTS